MRRNVLLSFFFCAAFVAALAATVYFALSYRQNGLLFGGNISDFTSGWKTGTGETVSLPGVVGAGADGAGTLTRQLPATLQDDSVLCLNTSYQSLTVSVGDQVIYAWDSQGKTSFVRPFGLTCYLIDLPASAAGQPLTLTLTPNQPGAGVSVYSITIGSGVAVSAALIRQNLDTAVLFFVLAVLSAFICVSALIFRKRFTGQSSLEALYLAAFAALAAVWMISDSNLSLLLTRNVAVTLYASLFSVMLLPAPLLLFLRRFTPHGKPVLVVLCGMTLLNFAVHLVLMFFGKADLTITLIISHILDLLACVTVLALCCNEYFRHKRRDVLEVFVGFGLLCVFGILSVIFFNLKGAPEGANFLRAGLTAFVLTLGAGVARRSIHNLARSKSYEKLTLSIPSGICRVESYETGRIIFANSFYYKMFGYTETQARNAGFTTAYFCALPEDLKPLKEKIGRFVADGRRSFETESRFVSKNGEVIWILARYKMEHGRDGVMTLVMIDITDRKRMEEKLRISEEEYRIATLHSNKQIIRLDIRSRTIYHQCRGSQPSDAPQVLEDVPGSIISSGRVAQDSIETLNGFYDAIFRGEREGSAVMSVYDADSGEYRWYHYDFTSIFNDKGEPIQAIISYYDVTLQRQKELAFQRWQQSYNAIPKSASNYYEYNLTNDMFEHGEGAMLPPPPENIPITLHGFSSYIASQHVFTDDRIKWLSFMSRDRLLENYSSGHHTDKTEFRRLSDDGPKWTSVSVQLIPDPYSSDVKGYFLLEDIDEQKKAEITLQERSTLDALTGLLNRVTFIEKFDEILKNSNLETQHALIMLDIDNFKTINDTLGHVAGDALLMNVANKLKYALRSDDLCGRLGGDEFVICLKSMNIGKPLEKRVNDLCEMICDEQSLGVAVSASFGIASFPNDGTTFDELYEKADIALYKAKAQGRGRFAVYDPQLSFDDINIAFHQR